MNALVGFTILACLQIPLMTLWTYLFVCKREKSEADGGGGARSLSFSLLTVLLLSFSGLNVLWSNSPSHRSRVFSMIIISVFTITSLLLAAYVCFVIPKDKSRPHKDSAKRNFYGMITFAIILIISTSWMYFDLIS